MEKTIKEWFEEVQDEHTRDILFKYNRSYGQQILDRIVPAFGFAINYAFRWSDTDEGFRFWNEVCVRYLYTNNTGYKSFKLKKPVIPELVEFEW